MKVSIKRNDYLIESASNFHSAVGKVISYEYDCILLDIMLPGGSGLEILKEIKKTGEKRNRHHYFGKRCH